MSTLIQRAKNFIPQLSEDALQVENTGQVPVETVNALREAELLNLLTPACFEGAETDFTTTFEVVRTLARGCMSTAWVATVGNAHNWLVTGFSEDCQKDYFADAKVFSAASFAPSGVAELIDDGFVISGTWGFLSGIDHAQWAFVTAVLAEGTKARQAGPWFLMVPQSELQILQDSWQVSGMSGTGSKSVTVEKLFVPNHRAAFLPALHANQGPGLGLHAGSLYKAAFQPALVAVLAAPILGATEAALDHFITYTRNRTVRMTGARQAEQIPSQLVVGEIAATVSAAACVLERIFERVDTTEPLAAEEQAEITRDTAYATSLLVQSMQTMIANAGGTVAQLDNPIQRTWRDVQVASNHAAINLAMNLQKWGAQALTD